MEWKVKWWKNICSTASINYIDNKTFSLLFLVRDINKLWGQYETIRSTVKQKLRSRLLTQQSANMTGSIY